MTTTILTVDMEIGQNGQFVTKNAVKEYSSVNVLVTNHSHKALEKIVKKLVNQVKLKAVSSKNVQSTVDIHVGVNTVNVQPVVAVEVWRVQELAVIHHQHQVAHNVLVLLKKVNHVVLLLVQLMGNTVLGQTTMHVQ